MKEFKQINSAYNKVFNPNALSIGLVIAIESYALGALPTMRDHLLRVQQIENLGFKAIWVRDVPFNVPSFGDVGQMFDPFSYLGFLAGQTSEIALGIASIALPLHHPLHVAKSASAIDQFSNGRMILGVASGDRPEEYPAMGVDFENRGELFRESFQYIRNVIDDFPILETNNFGKLEGHIDMLPKPIGQKIPMLVTGSSRQTMEWNVKNADGWMNYPRDLDTQRGIIKGWRNLIEFSEEFDRPYMQPLYIDLHENDNHRPQPIHLGFRMGVHYLITFLDHLREIGVNHLALNLRFNRMNMDRTLERIASRVLPEFHINKKEEVTP